MGTVKGLWPRLPVLCCQAILLIVFVYFLPINNNTNNNNNVQQLESHNQIHGMIQMNKLCEF